jgi:hypothetical protein
VTDADKLLALKWSERFDLSPGERMAQAVAESREWERLACEEIALSERSGHGPAENWGEAAKVARRIAARKAP